MYKSRLQELCHQRLWALPEYTSTREGPDHNPRFRATVIVNGVSFHAADVSKTSKEAQNKAAQAAVEHFTSVGRSLAPPQPSPMENQMPYKVQLQTFVQRKNGGLPIYSFVRKGLPHAPCFKAAVTVAGKTFESSQYFSTLKEAEHDAAKVALMSFPSEENLQVEMGFYKNLLQELAHKEGFSWPKYTTIKDGACHMPIFASTVEIGGESFEGDVAKSKKQAEINAAKFAWCMLNERKDKLDSTTADSINPDNQKTHSPSGFMENDDSLNDQFATPVQKLKDPEITMMQAATEGTCSLLCNRIRVYPHKLDMVLPEGTTLLPFGDDMWAAVNIDFSNQKGGVLV